MLIYREKSGRKSLQRQEDSLQDYLENDAGDGTTVERVEAGIDILCSSSDFELDEAFSEGPSLHKIQMQASATAWERIRQKLLRAVVESKALPANQVCTK